MMVDSWDVINKKVYWDRDISLGVWREKVMEGHRSYLPDAISVLKPNEFVYFLGVEEFKLNWVNMRSKLPNNYIKYTGFYDIVWSKLMGGGWNLYPAKDFYKSPKRRLEFLVAVSRSPGKSIYEVAKELNMQYRRAHDHAKYLIETNKIKSVFVVENGHKKLKLYPIKN